MLRTAARILGVSVSALRRLEGRRLLQPERKGRAVVYTQAMVERAQRLLVDEPPGGD